MAKLDTVLHIISGTTS